jgi:choline monooxygenase
MHAFDFDPALPLDLAVSPPSSWYVDSRHYQAERRPVFHESWQPAARLESLSSPGSFVTVNVADLPLVLVRDHQGILRAFVNVCRHRAAEVAQGCGTAFHWTCPYHGWSYALDGSLRRAPGLGRARGFRIEEHGLAPVAAAEWGPFAWIHAGTSPRPLATDLSPLLDRFQESDFSSLRFHIRRTYELACNWKVFVDNYLDGGYHVSTLHPGLAGQLDLGAYRTEVFERCSIQSCSADAAPGTAGEDFAERIGQGAIYAWIYPNFMINRYGPLMDTNWVLPLGPERCLTIFDYFVDPSDPAVDDAFLTAALAASHQVQLEDVAICESVQRGHASGRYVPGRYAAPESAMHAFHRLLHAAMVGAEAIDRHD